MPRKKEVYKETKLYKKTTDGGAEYLCTKHIKGCKVGDIKTAIVRLDGDPLLISHTKVKKLYMATFNLSFGSDGAMETYFYTKKLTPAEMLSDITGGNEVEGEGDDVSYDNGEVLITFQRVVVIKSLDDLIY